MSGTWTAPRSNRQRPRRSGLTLIELLVVLALIVVMTGAILPSLGNYGAASRLRAGARGVVSQMRYAREIAVRHNTHARFEIDADTGLSRVSELTTVEPESEPQWHADTHAGGLPRALPDGVRFARSAARGSKPAQSVMFSPDGRGEDWFVVIADRRDEQLIVRVEPTLGTARVLSASDGQDYQELLRAAESGS